MDNTENYVKMLAEAPRNKWIALSDDESRIVGIGDSMEDAVSAAAEKGIREPVLLKSPIQWGYSVL